MPACIYCRRTDPPCGFNVEHVIPEALGEFKLNGVIFTLRNSECCKECNQEFGDTIDRLLNRDSVEALLRYRFSLKTPGDLKGMFTKRVRARLPEDGTKWGGVYLDFVPPPSGDLEPYLELAPQFACERRDGRGWIYFSEEEIRERSEEVKRRIKSECSGACVVWTTNDADKQRMLALLPEKGIPFKGDRAREVTELVPHFADGHVTAAMEFTFDKMIARAIAKIAFNYLAKIHGADFALRSEFDEVRQFIRHGVGRPQDFVHPDDGPMLGRKGRGDPNSAHVITVYWSSDRRDVLAQLSLFNYMLYQVRLCRNFGGLWREILSGHVFDLTTMQVEELHKTTIIPPERVAWVSANPTPRRQG